MRSYRGYVSKAQEGILSAAPEAEEYDTVPPVQGADRVGYAGVGKGGAHLRGARRDLELSPGGPESAASEAGDVCGGKEGACAGGTEEDGRVTGSAPSSSMESLSEGAPDDGPAENGEELSSTRTMESLPEGEKPRPHGRFFTPRVLVAALVINVVLLGIFALVMYLDRPPAPVRVHYIELVDPPAGSANTDRTSPSGGTKDNVPVDEAEPGQLRSR